MQRQLQNCGTKFYPRANFQRLKNFENYISETRKVWCIIWYTQILGAIFFGTFWISTHRAKSWCIFQSEMSLLGSRLDAVLAKMKAFKDQLKQVSQEVDSSKSVLQALAKKSGVDFTEEEQGKAFWFFLIADQMFSGSTSIDVFHFLQHRIFATFQEYQYTYLDAAFSWKFWGCMRSIR